jgi:hypothetical protein
MGECIKTDNSVKEIVWIDVCNGAPYRLYFIFYMCWVTKIYIFIVEWIMCGQYLSRGVFDTTLCDKVCQWVPVSLWFPPGTPVSSSNKTDRHDIAEILLKVALSTITLSLTLLNGKNEVILLNHYTAIIFFSREHDLLSGYVRF